MTKHQVLLTAGLAFFLGCASAPFVEALVVPRLSAQQIAAGVQRWEHQCVLPAETRSQAAYVEEVNEIGRRMGAEGRELATSPGMLCFKRPLH
ncbi:MAG: hypothetical protein H6726_24040 [Sandaracinaceae bacterium]|nr:hypothetical protein [Myxococcales bacterium]MCB9660737.1 hypothetical protein [Sandaracinaceae bacterium]